MDEIIVSIPESSWFYLSNGAWWMDGVENMVSGFNKCIEALSASIVVQEGETTSIISSVFTEWDAFTFASPSFKFYRSQVAGTISSYWLNGIDTVLEDYVYYRVGQQYSTRNLCCLSGDALKGARNTEWGSSVKNAVTRGALSGLVSCYDDAENIAYEYDMGIYTGIWNYFNRFTYASLSPINNLGIKGMKLVTQTKFYVWNGSSWTDEGEHTEESVWKDQDTLVSLRCGYSESTGGTTASISRVISLSFNERMQDRI